MKKILYVVPLVLFSLGLGLLAQTFVTAAVPQQSVTMRIFRTGSHSNAIQILIDRKNVFKLSNHESATFQLSPGSHEIAARYGDRRPSLTIDTKVGKEYVFELALKVHRAAMFQIVAPADAIQLDLIRQPPSFNPDHSKPHNLDAHDLAKIYASRAVVPDP